MFYLLCDCFYFFPMGFGPQFTEFTGREKASDTTYSFLYELMGNKHNDLFLLQCVFFYFPWVNSFIFLFWLTQSCNQAQHQKQALLFSKGYWSNSLLDFLNQYKQGIDSVFLKTQVLVVIALSLYFMKRLLLGLL